MQVSHEYLTRLRQDAEARRSTKMAELHQIVGAISILDALLAEVAKPEPEAPAAEAEAVTVE
jgi:hypothetical protein